MTHRNHVLADDGHAVPFLVSHLPGFLRCEPTSLGHW